MASRHDTYQATQRSPWQENHGNFLLAFATVVLVAGLAILAYRQWRPVSPTIRHIRADSESIEGVQEDVELSLETPAERSSDDATPAARSGEAALTPAADGAVD